MELRKKSACEFMFLELFLFKSWFHGKGSDDEQ